MSIDDETARRIARLARIRVEPEALPALAEELSSILGWVEQLQQVDVAGVEPMTSVTPMALPLRPDEVSEPDRRDPILAQAPDTREGFFVVPKVVE